MSKKGKRFSKVLRKREETLVYGKRKMVSRLNEERYANEARHKVVLFMAIYGESFRVNGV